MLMSMKSTRSLCSVLLLAVAAMLWPASANAQAAQDAPTFNADVGRILYDNCATCHREGEIAPMVLTSYKAARPWARAIKTKVVSREMPPWFADPRYGHFQDVLAMSQAEIDTIAAWVDGGAPEGTGPAPDVPVFSSDWRHDRPPDYVVEMPLEIELPAQGEVNYVEIWMDNPRTEDLYLEAVQMRAGNPAVVHHGGIFTRELPPGTKIGEEPIYTGSQLVPQPVPINPNEGPEVKLARTRAAMEGLSSDAQLIFYRPGGGYNRYPEGTAKRVYGDRPLMFQMHYTLTGKPETDRSSAGFWFAKEPPHHQVLTVGAGKLGGSGSVRIVENTEQLGTSPFATTADSPRIPANADDFKVTGIWPIVDDVTIYGVWPHMHFRGKDMTYIISYPDGTEETMLSVPNYDFNWQMEYDFVEPLKVPAGSTIKTVGHYDNSVRNRYNPSPDQEVHWSEQSWDEMFFIFTKYTVDKNDLSLEN
jgi:mono/diheme cytochrome c family protein